MCVGNKILTMIMIYFLVFKSFMSYWARHKYKGMILTKKDAIAMTSIQVVILAAHVS